MHPSKKDNPAQEPILLIDSHHGIYSAQLCAKEYETTLPAWAKKILLAGPDHPDYVQTWGDELSSAKVRMASGQWWDIVENEDMWAVPPGMDLEGWLV